MHLFLLIGQCQREASSVRAMVRSRLRVEFHARNSGSKKEEVSLRLDRVLA